MVRTDFRVSAVIPVKNGERYLADAIDSVLGQTFPCEIIVVDDNSSTEATAKIARAYGDRVRYAQIQIERIGAARNHGVQMARGDIIAFLDHDDIWLPDKVSLQVAALDADPGLDIVFGHVVEFSEATRSVRKAHESPMPGMIPSAAAVRATSMARVGPFATHIRLAEWMDWFGRARHAGLRYRVLDQTVTRRRIHDANTGMTQGSFRGEYLQVAKSLIDERRARASTQDPDDLP